VVPQGNASANQVLQGSTFMNSSGQTITGTMTEYGYYTDYSGYLATNNETIYLGIKPGAYLIPTSAGYPEITIPKSKVNNLRPENIVSGKEILGVWGTYSPATYSITSYPTPGGSTPAGYNVWCNYSKQVATGAFHEYTSPIAPGTGTYYVYVNATYVLDLELQFVRSDGSIAAQGIINTNGSKIFTITMPANMEFTIKKVSGKGAMEYVKSYYILNILS
jgi:hypothetical protein